VPKKRKSRKMRVVVVRVAIGCFTAICRCFYLARFWLFGSKYNQETTSSRTLHVRGTTGLIPLVCHPGICVALAGHLLRSRVGVAPIHGMPRETV
jgi:hypothetical protein